MLLQNLTASCKYDASIAFFVYLNHFFLFQLPAFQSQSLEAFCLPALTPDFYTYYSKQPCSFFTTRQSSSLQKKNVFLQIPSATHHCQAISVYLWTLCEIDSNQSQLVLAVISQTSGSADCCCSSVIQLCLTLCDPMDCSMPGLPVPHHLLEFAQVHVHCISDAVRPSHPLTPSSPSALNLSQHQGLFQ